MQKKAGKKASTEESRPFRIQHKPVESVSNHVVNDVIFGSILFKTLSK